MKKQDYFDDDNLVQIADDSFAVVNYNNDTMIILGHCDTVINNKHVIIDTFKTNDTVYVEKTLFDDEIRIIEKLIDKPNFGTSAVSLLIIGFIIYSVIKKWNCNKKE